MHIDPFMIKNEYQEFVHAQSMQPSLLLESRLKQRLKLIKSPWPVFFKLTCIHLVSGFLSLLVCPQFGINPLGGAHGLMHWTMAYGPLFCAFVCGALFFSLTACMVALFVRGAQRQLIKQHQLWQFSLLAVLSYAGLMLVSSVLSAVSVSLFFSVFWILGAVVGAQVIYRLLDTVGTFVVTGK